MNSGTLQSPYRFGTKIPDKLSSKWNSGKLHVLLGPVALISVLIRGIFSSGKLIFQSKDYSLIGMRILNRNDKIKSAKVTKMIVAKIINKLHLFLSSVIGSAFWATLAYFIASGIPGGTSLALFKLIAAVVTALAATPGFPFICIGFGVVCIAVALVNYYFSGLPSAEKIEENPPSATLAHSPFSGAEPFSKYESIPELQVKNSALKID